MNYIIAIKTAIFIFPLIALLFTIPFILIQYHKYGSVNKLRVLIVYSFILYLLVIYFLVILPLPKWEDVQKMPILKIRLIPCSFIGDIIRESSFSLTQPKTYLKSLTEPCIYTVLFNILMTIPFGMYLRYYFKCSRKQTLGFSFLLSLFFEITQLTGLYFIYPKPYRIFDVDDLMMNSLGGVIGYLVMGVIDKYLPTRDEIDRKSLAIGRQVSGIRRITLFYLDIFIYLAITIFMRIFIKTIYLKYITFIIYYIIIPYFWHGKTLASSFLNVRLEFPNKTLLRITIRAIFNYIYYFVFIYFLIAIIPNISNSNLQNNKVFIYFISIIAVTFFYIIHIFTIWKNKTVYYDKFFKVKYISTISERSDLV